MPAPKTPNTERATAQRKANAHQRKLEAAAALLESNGWLPLRPFEVADLSGGSDAYVASYVRTSISTRVELRAS